MKVSKAKLLAAIDDAEASAQRADDEYQAARAEFDAHRERVWREEMLPLWKEAAALINKAVRYKQHLSADDLKAVFGQSENEYRGRYDPFPFYHQHGSSTFYWGDRTYGPVHPHRSLAPLRRLLDATPDETISSSSLESMGFRDLSWLFARAVEQ